jgi:hypothetical protein
LGDTKLEFVVPRVPRSRATPDEIKTVKEADQRAMVGIKRLVDGWYWTFGPRGSQVPVSVAYANISAKCRLCCKCVSGEKNEGDLSQAEGWE